jgi:hypothetical protein
VTGQWHLRNPSEKHKFSAIILKQDDSTIVLELVATGNRAFIQSHIEKTSEYMSLLSADEAWVVHFTCEDDLYHSGNLILTWMAGFMWFILHMT